VCYYNLTAIFDGTLAQADQVAMESENFVVMLVGYLILIGFLLYVVICGNNKFHRNGLVGWCYRFFTDVIPRVIRRVANKICPCWFRGKSGEELCFGPNRCCRYCVVVFYYGIYIFFMASYLFDCYPFLEVLHPATYQIHKFLSFFVLPWPWIIVIALHAMDPGEITNENVESYLKIYPYDNVLYSPSFCRTLHIPVVPRSRYCRYSRKRIAFSLLF